MSSAPVKSEEPKLSNAFLADIEALDAEMPVVELIGVVAKAPCDLPVIDKDQRYLGVVTKASLLETLDRDAF